MTLRLSLNRLTTEQVSTGPIPQSYTPPRLVVPRVFDDTPDDPPDHFDYTPDDFDNDRRIDLDPL